MTALLLLCIGRVSVPAANRPDRTAGRPKSISRRSAAAGFHTDAALA
jgi:hypothetical protein